MKFEISEHSGDLQKLFVQFVIVAADVDEVIDAINWTLSLKLPLALNAFTASVMAEFRADPDDLRFRRRAWVDRVARLFVHVALH